MRNAEAVWHAGPYSVKEWYDLFVLMEGEEILADFQTLKDARKTVRLLRTEAPLLVAEGTGGRMYRGELPREVAEWYEAELALLEEARKEGKQQDPNAEEVLYNCAVFQANLGKYMTEHAGKFALMKNGEAVEFFDTSADAFRAGALKYKSIQAGGKYSIQEVTDQPVFVSSHSVVEYR